MQNQTRLNEIEVKMSELERENFDLKMRLYYLNNEKKNETRVEDETERVVNILSQRDLTYEQLRSANEDAHNRIAELQSELTVLKAKQDSNNTSYENLLLKNQRLGSLQLEENLKRERQAAQAIAKHDAALIANYEKELERLKDIHSADTLLISECSERVGELMNIIEQKNKELERQQQNLIAAQQHVEVLTDRISKQEILLIKNEQTLKSNAISSLSRALNPPPPPPISSSSPSLFSSNFDNSSFFNSHPSQSQSHLHPQSNYLNNNNNNNNNNKNNNNHHNNGNYFLSQQPGSIDNHLDSSVGGLKPAPKLGAPFFVTEELEPSTSNSSSSFQNYHQSNTIHGNNNNNNNNNNMNRSLSPSHRSSSPYLSSSNSFPNNHHNLHPLSTTQELNHSFPLRRDQKELNSSYDSNNLKNNQNNHHQSTSYNKFPSPPRTLPKQFTSTSNNTSPLKQKNVSYSNQTNLKDNEETEADNVFATNKLKSVLYRELESTRLQVKALTEENDNLKESLEKNKIFIQNQEKALEKVRSSAEEITLLEAEEIARLEVELERMKEERDKWMSSSKKYETQVELLRQELFERTKNEELFNASIPSPSEYYQNNKNQSIASSSSNNSPSKYRLSSSFEPSNSSSFRPSTNKNDKNKNNNKNRFGNHSPLNNNNMNQNGNGNRNHNYTPQSPDDSPAIEMYRQREVELLEALEGVVKRCHELEAQVGRK